MANYSYLIASLPMLSLDATLPISYQAFLSKCRDILSKGDYAELERATFTPSEGARNTLMRKWEGYIDEVSHLVKQERTKRLGWQSGESPVIINNPVLQDRIHRATFSMNPLEGEKEILAIYFDFLDSNTPSDVFSLEALMIYALKIQIIERLNAFSVEKGRNEFRTLFGRIQEQFDRKDGEYVS